MVNTLHRGGRTWGVDGRVDHTQAVHPGYVDYEGCWKDFKGAEVVVLHLNTSVIMRS